MNMLMTMQEDWFKDKNLKSSIFWDSDKIVHMQIIHKPTNIIVVGKNNSLIGLKSKLLKKLKEKIVKYAT